MSLLQHDDRKRAPSAEAAVVEGEGPVLDLLDEYWFFSNTLVKNGRGRRPPLLPKSPSTTSSSRCGDRVKDRGMGKGSAPAAASRFYESGCRRLIRTPSLPSPRAGLELAKDEEIVEEAGDQEVEDDDLNWSSIYEGVLRTRIAEGGGGRSTLHRAPSMPVPLSVTEDDDGRHEEMATAATKSTSSMSRLRHSYSSLERHCRSHTPTKADRTARTLGGERSRPGREVQSFSANQQPIVRYKNAFQDKKWKSSSDLESIEVQGFKDLGFVFDQEELRESLADVLPGLRGKSKKSSGSGSGSDNDEGNANANGGSDVRRPYLSEAWHHVQRSAPPAIRLQADARSAAEMKDQIRMWAQAVACNVRQEC